MEPATMLGSPTDCECIVIIIEFRAARDNPRGRFTHTLMHNCFQITMEGEKIEERASKMK